MMSLQNACLFALLISSLLSCRNNNTVELSKEWRTYRGDDGINAYSGLNQINRDNVSMLQVAWIYRSGDTSKNSTIETNPLIINGILYGISPKQKTFALDAKTGKEIWTFNPYDSNSQEGGVSRGLTWWEDGDDQRIFISASYRLIALNAKTGRQITDFGENGFVDLRKGLRNDDEIEKYYITNTSPGVIYKDLIIIGSSLNETYEGLPGDIRAYDVRSGKLKWSFHTVPKPGEPGYETWPAESYKLTGGCNAWSGLSIDKKRGIVFAATGTPQADFHGGDRAGANLYGNSVIAIDASTGKHIWHFQVSHHDTWDYDLPSPPNLITLKRNGKNIDAVAQITKQGWIFIFDRETGKPLFPIEERAVPASDMPDEHLSPTQPFPLLPPPLVRQKFDTSDVTDISPESREYILNKIKNFSFGKIYHPQSTKGIIQLPGFRGGAEWSGAAFDPETGKMFIGVNEIPNIVQLVEIKPEDPNTFFKMPVLKAGEMVYQNNCSPCHGADRKGHDAYPALLGIEKKLNPGQAQEVIEKGRSKMPSFVNMPAAQKEALIAFLYNLKKDKLSSANYADTVTVNSNAPKRYTITDYTQLKDQFGYYGIKPPWGTLNAVNLNTGEIVWKRTLGEYPELTKKGIPETGTQLFGGGIVTAGGLIFIGASKDGKFRAIDKDTGKTIWEYQLPAGGYATPSTYEIEGKQYVVIAAGGGGMQATKSGDYYIAFALPD
ncbi:MAG: PQQ-binding-like beta-propeller repeat protein [Bacteroidetes bacterium]|nr:PQQ-binding-like beta-propeller repeat protein [Bacteroidota bacterium]